MAETNFITTELAKFDVLDAKLQELAAAGKGLTIAKDGAETVTRARINIKNERVRIQKKGKELRDDANAFNKAVLAKEKEYLAVITPVEDELMAEEKRAADEAARVEQLRKEAEQAKVTDRINKLSALGYIIDYTRALTMTDEQFAVDLFEAQASFDAEQRSKADEQLRMEESRKLLEAQQAEAARIAKEQADKQREIELAAQKVRLEQEAVENQRRQQLEHEAQLKAQADRAAKAAEDARIQAEKDAEAARIKAEREKAAAIEAERKRVADEQVKKEAAIAAEKRKAALAPDKDKLTALSLAFKSYELPELSMPEASVIIDSVRTLLGKVSAYIDTQVGAL